MLGVSSLVTVFPYPQLLPAPILPQSMSNPRPLGDHELRLIELFVNCRLDMTPLLEHPSRIRVVTDYQVSERGMQRQLTVSLCEESATAAPLFASPPPPAYRIWQRLEARSALPVMPQ